MPLRALSYTSIRTYLGCPLRWRFRYRDGLASEDTGAQKLGRALHRAIERRDRGGVGSLLAAFEAAARREGGLDAGTLERGRRILRDVRLREGWGRAEIIGVERPFEVEIEGVEVRGIVDRIEAGRRGGVSVVDLKTNPRLAPWSAKGNRQLTLYQIGVEEGLGHDVRELALVSLTTGIRARAPRRTREPVDDLKTLVLRTAADIDARRFEPRLGPRCPCEYAPRCPFFADKYPKIEDWDGAQRARVAGIVDRFAATGAPEDSVEIERYLVESGLRRAWGRSAVVDRVPLMRYDWDLERVALATGSFQTTPSEGRKALLDCRRPPKVRAEIARARRPRIAGWRLVVRKPEFAAGEAGRDASP